MDLTTESPTDTETGLTAGKATAVLVTGPGSVLIEVQDANSDWVPIHEGASPGTTIPVLIGTQIRATLRNGAASTVSIQQSA